MNCYKKRIVLDFDGVIHSYTSGWKGITVIPDEPVMGALEKIKEYLEAGFSVAIFSSRSCTREGRTAIQEWLIKWGFPWQCIEIPDEKPPAVLYVDDRGFQFKGIFPDVSYINNFKPWGM